SPYSLSWDTTTIVNGTHTLKARARDAAGNSTISAGVSVTVSNVDSTAPTVALTSPAATATVSGTITVRATASDNVGVASVQFLLNGAALGREDTVAPYAINWNTTTVANGSYSLAARARDTAGHLTTSASVNVTVGNAAPTGLVAAYGFNEGAGTTAADASGHALAGAVANATWAATGKFGKALSFNGSNAWVTVTDNTLLRLTN